jgi:hypothetical protein
MEVLASSRCHFCLGVTPKPLRVPPNQSIQTNRRPPMQMGWLLRTLDSLPVPVPGGDRSPESFGGGKHVAWRSWRLGVRQHGVQSFFTQRREDAKEATVSGWRVWKPNRRTRRLQARPGGHVGSNAIALGPACLSRIVMPLNRRRSPGSLWSCPRSHDFWEL